MRILMLSDYFYPHIGGVEKHLEYVSQELVKRGHEITILTRRYNPELNTIDQYKKLKILRFNEDRIGSKYEWIKNNEDILQNYDVVHCHDFGTFIYWYLPFKFKYRNKPVYITFHGYEGFPINDTAIYMRKVSEEICDGNICVGKYIKKWYGTDYDFLTYGGVKKNSISGSKKYDSNVAFVGRLELDTGIVCYVKSLNILNKIYGKIVKLKICGDGSLRKYLENYAKENKLNIEFFGFQKHPERCIDDCEVSFTSSYLSMLESMINRRFVISVYENQLKKDYLECFPNSNNIFEICSSPEEVAYKLNEIMVDKELKYLKINRGYELAQNQTWSKVTDIYEKLYGLR